MSKFKVGDKAYKPKGYKFPCIEYTTKYYPDSGKYHCTCMGYWRSKDRRCKHIKAMELKMKK